jgi:two-component system OmpR family sensor kinase
MVKRFAPRGVRARLCLAFTLTAAVVALGGSLLFVHVIRVGLSNNLDNNLEARAQTIAGVLDGTAAPKLPDPLLIDPSTRAIAQDTVETFAVVRRPDGLILTATGAPAPHLSLPNQLLHLQDGGLARTTINVGDQAYRVAALAVKRPDGIWLALAGTSRRANDEALHDLSNALFFALPVLVLMVALGAWVLAGAALRPVERMRRDAAAHGGTGNERLAVPPTGDELARLAVTLNELLGRLGSSLARQQDLVADAGHELRTPLAVLRTELELASRPGRTHEELADAVEHAALEVNRLSQLAEDLLFLARADSNGPLVRPQPTDLAGVLQAAIRSARASADVAGVTLSAEVAPELTAVRRCVGDPPGGRQPAGQRHRVRLRQPGARPGAAVRRLRKRPAQRSPSPSRTPGRDSRRTSCPMRSTASGGPTRRVRTITDSAAPDSALPSSARSPRPTGAAHTPAMCPAGEPGFR